MSKERMLNADEQRVKRALDTLSEHFDAVHIFASRCESGELNATVRCDVGSGNWFARYGQVACWIKAQDQVSCNDVSRKDDHEQ